MKILQSYLENESSSNFQRPAEDMDLHIEDQDIKPLINDNDFDIGTYFHYNEVLQDPERYLHETFSLDLFGLTDKMLQDDFGTKEWESGDGNISFDERGLEPNSTHAHSGMADHHLMDHVGEKTETETDDETEADRIKFREDHVLIQPLSKMILENEPSPLFKCSLCGATFSKIRLLHLHIASLHKKISLKASTRMKSDDSMERHSHHQSSESKQSMKSEESLSRTILAGQPHPNLLKCLGLLKRKIDVSPDRLDQVIQFMN